MYKIYLFDQLELVTEKLIEDTLSLLPEERCKKAMRYRRQIDRKNCAITFLMLKVALKENFQIVNFTLRYGEYGKPYLVEYPDIYFNISHCCYGCIVAISDRAIGVDIQDIRLFSFEVARRVCCREELEVLEQSIEKNREFTRIWAMKESYIKMLGRGIENDLIKINVLTMKYIKILDGENYVISICLGYEK